jgi:hypothetical protein
MFGLWIKQVVLFRMPGSLVTLVNHITTTEGSFFMLILCEISWNKVSAYMMHVKIIQNGIAHAM